MGWGSLTLSFLSVDRALGSRAALSSSPLLAMPQLRELRLAQVDWKSEDVEAMLDLRQASRSAKRDVGQTIEKRGRRRAGRACIRAYFLRFWSHSEALWSKCRAAGWLLGGVETKAPPRVPAVLHKQLHTAA